MHIFMIVFPPVLVLYFRLGVVHFWLYLPYMFGDFIWCLPNFDDFPNSQVCLSPPKVSLLTGWFVVKKAWIFSTRFNFIAQLILLPSLLSNNATEEKTDHCKTTMAKPRKNKKMAGKSNPSTSSQVKQDGVDPA